MMEAEGSTSLSPLVKARQLRNGLMVAMLALHPIRLKNFASLEIGRNLANIDGWWWITLSAAETKEVRPDERRIDDAIAPALSKYLTKYRPVLARESRQSGALWLSPNNGRPMTYHAVADVIERTTRTTIGVGVSPHMFRSAAASSAAVHADYNPYLGSAVLHHRDKRVTEEHYNRRERVWSAHQAANRGIALTS
jgi:integrase